MRRPLFFACWKANKSAQEVLDFFAEVHKRGLELKDNTEVVLAPCAIHYEIARLKMPKPLILGAQDVSDIEIGGRMGEVTAKMLQEYGVKYCVVGHWEWRQNFENDAVINKKIKLLQQYGVTPVLCVGENWNEYQNNIAKDVIKRQVQGALAGVANVNDLVICYRPAWIGERGTIPSADYVNIMAGHIRKCLRELKSNPLDSSLPILYGGQVTPKNVQEYMKQTELDGIFFIGSALNIDSFYGVINYDQNK